MFQYLSSIYYLNFFQNSKSALQAEGLVILTDYSEIPIFLIVRSQTATTGLIPSYTYYISLLFPWCSESSK